MCLGLVAGFEVPGTSESVVSTWCKHPSHGNRLAEPNRSDVSDEFQRLRAIVQLACPFTG